MRSKNITESEREKLRYHLIRFEYLVKRKAGQYVMIDPKSRRIIASGEQKKLLSENKLAGKGEAQEVIKFLKLLNAELEHESNWKEFALYRSLSYAKSKEK